MTSPSTLKDIRRAFLNYFEQNGHTLVPSSSLVPDNDPTLLFTNAGMVQFKDYFTGRRPAPFPRATTSQKCVRAGGKHNDLENVGYTARHHTFFEMLGNFSFGDYFKERAINQAWEVVTKVFGLPPERLCVTVHPDDEEAAKLWKQVTGFSDSKIIRLKENSWSMGDTGPCGPCTEIFYDHGEGVAGGPPGSKDEDGDRFTEIWNLVFMQFEQRADGTRGPLPRPSIDTGMGLERMAAVLQRKHSNFEIDLFADLIAEIRRQTGQEKGLDQSCQVVADHIRSISFLIADGVLPLNEGRGYVLRRIIRRAIRHARMLGAKDPILYNLVGKVGELMGDQYPELIQHRPLIQNVLKDEEERFGETLDRGLRLVEESIQDLHPGMTLPGDVAFKLYDTYGFPVDLTADILKGKGIGVDLEGFDAAMQRQKALSKQTQGLGIKTTSTQIATELEKAKIPSTTKLCYACEDELAKAMPAKVLALFPGEGERMTVVLDQTPFFAESGGQVGDTGWIGTANGNFEVLQTTAAQAGDQSWVLHEGILRAPLTVGDEVEVKIDLARRLRIAAHHSATHLLQAALREVLGTHVTQKGSSVDADRLRFDFTHPKELTAEEKAAVEARVNQAILSALPCQTLVCSKEEALTQGALAFFDEKYGDKVRLVQLGEQKGAYASQELCGGTHVLNTGRIGLFKLVSEAGIAAGIRRIEAVCGLALLAWTDRERTTASETIAHLKEEQHALNKQLQKLQAAEALGRAKVTQEVCGAVPLTIHALEDVPAQQAREIAEPLQKELARGVVVVTSTEPDKAVIIVGVAAKDQARISARDLLQLACAKMGGKGGGKANMAQGGGPNKVALNEALDTIRQKLREL